MTFTEAPGRVAEAAATAAGRTLPTYRGARDMPAMELLYVASQPVKLLAW